MKHCLTKEQDFSIRSMGKRLRVTAIFDNDDEANQHMASHPSDAVVACLGPFVLLADKYDKGETAA